MKKVLLKYNNIGHLDTSYQEKVLDLANFYQQLPYDHDFTVIETSDLDYSFAYEIPQDCEWAVVVAAGHTTQDRSLYDRLIGECRLLNATLMCHIMNFQGQYPHLHPQVFCINYQHWLQMGSPEWKHIHIPYNFTSTRFEASKETFHDEYTPHWIRPVAGDQEYTGNFLQEGASVIRACLEYGRSVYNIPQNIRSVKHHLYPDQDVEAFGNFLSGGKYTGNHPAQEYYSSLVLHLAEQVRKQYYVLNTEAMTEYQSSRVIDHYAGVGSGVKLFCMMVKNGFDSTTKATIFDFSEAALKFQQYIITNWAGDLDQYQSICKRFEDENPQYFPCLPSGSWQDNFNHILTELDISKQQFQEFWQIFRTVEKKFIPINLYDRTDQEYLALICRQYAQSYVWVSNAFWMEYSLIKLGKTELGIIRQEFLRALNDTSANIIIDINDFWHQGLLTLPYKNDKLAQ
jgi:hypothetical protein